MTDAATDIDRLRDTSSLLLEQREQAFDLMLLFAIEALTFLLVEAGFIANFRILEGF